MPRQPRLDAPGALHHVMGRGIDGIKIFSNKKDREDFLERLADLCKAAWCGCGALCCYKHFSSAVNSMVVSDELPEVEKYV